MLPAKVTTKVRGLLIRRVARLVRALEERRPDSLLADMARLVGDAGAMLDPEASAAAWAFRQEREGRLYARVCVWDGECEADATTDDGLCVVHAEEQQREQDEARALVERGEIASEDAG